MANLKIKFSIVTVVFNDVKNIENTMMSVLNQTHSEVEYIVIDGRSTDGTLEKIIELSRNNDRIRLISESDQGIYDAMNKGISHSNGEFINFMNSGDCFANNSVLSTVSKVLCENPKVDVLYGSVAVLSGDRLRVIKSSPKEKIRNFLPFCHQSVFVKKSVLNKFPFSLTYKYASDYDQFVSISKNQKILWSQHSDVFSSVTEGGAADYYRIVTAREYLEIARHHYGRANFSHWLLYLKVLLSRILKDINAQ